MRPYLKTLLGLAAATATLASCSKSQVSAPVSPDDPDNVAVNVTASIGADNLSRAVNDTWEIGDAIGIAMLRYGSTEVIDDSHNNHYVVSDVSGTFTPGAHETTLYFPQDGSNVTFHAYYPYHEDLGDALVIPVDVSDQSDLSEIDLLTAEHISGYSKTDSHVHLRFHHRLSKLVFNLRIAEGEGQYISLADCKLTIHGMDTEGQYDLRQERLYPDDASEEDLSIPVQTSTDTRREAIVLPRPAGNGVVFEFTTPDGGTYLAYMADDLALESGYKYTFNLLLERTPVTVSATIEPWIDGPSIDYDIVRVNTPAGESSGVNPGDEMNVYVNNTPTRAPEDFSLLGTFIYQTNGTWESVNPVYWESIEPDPAIMRASIIAAGALNTSQLPDILLADEISVPRNTGANFTLRHVTSKVFVYLRSTTFSDADLQGATITFPNYLTGGYEQNGYFVEGTQRATITVDRSDPAQGVALFQPQTIASGNLVTVTINGRDYNVAVPSGGYTYNEGEALQMTINLDKTEATFSVNVVDWTGDEIELNAVTIGTAVSGGEGVLDSEMLEVYTGDQTTRTYLNTYTYNAGTDTFTSPTTIYWESLPDQATFYGSIERAAALNGTQIPDWLVADPTTVQASNGVAFTLRHAAAQVVVQLESPEGTFTDEQLAAMNLTLPQYLTGATLNNGVFVPGTQPANVTVQKNAGTGGNSAIALIQPQTVKAGTNVITVLDPATNRTYTATYAEDIVFTGGVSTVLTVRLDRTGLTISARVIDWEPGQNITLVPTAIEVKGSLGATDDFFENKAIYVYRTTAPIQAASYSYTSDGTSYNWQGGNIYWDDQQDGTLRLGAAYYPPNITVPNLAGGNVTTFPVQIQADQRPGIAPNDLLMSTLYLSSPQIANFQFTHTFSKVIIRLESDQFTDEELATATVQLNGFALNGTADLTTAAVSGVGGAVNILSPQVVTAGETYQAIVMPQTRTTDQTIVTVTLDDYPNTPFPGKLEADLTFLPGHQHIITVRLNRTAIELSARLEPWITGETGEVIID